MRISSDDYPDDSHNDNGDNKVAVEAEENQKSLVDELWSIHDKDYFGYAMNVIQRTVKQDPSLVKQIMYTGLSAFTKDPINLLISAPTSEGKTYPVVETLKPFPSGNVWLLDSITPKVVIRQSGVLVDSKNNPIEVRIKELKREILKLTRDDNDEEALDRKQGLDNLIQESKVLIDLNNWIFVFLEPPHPETWAIMKPILSHDNYECKRRVTLANSGRNCKPLLIDFS